MNRKEFSKEITLFGGSLDFVTAEKVLLENGIDHEDQWLKGLNESEIRMKFFDLINGYNLKVEVMYKGNCVQGKERILRNVRTIAKHNDMNKMNKFFYEFLHQHCGSIAHYNMYGWIGTYPTVQDLRIFFQKNEFGKRPSEHVPHWQPDTKQIILEIEQVLGVPTAWSNVWK